VTVPVTPVRSKRRKLRCTGLLESTRNVGLVPKFLIGCDASTYASASIFGGNGAATPAAPDTRAATTPATPSTKSAPKGRPQRGLDVPKDPTILFPRADAQANRLPHTAISSQS